MKWAALNLGSDACVNRDPSVWDKQRGLYRAAGIPIGPWMHCRSLADIDFLIFVGATWPDAKFIGCNIEDVVGDKLSLQQVGGVLLDFWVNKYQKPVHMPTLPWVQNGQGWNYVDFAYLALEMFPEVDPRYLRDYQGCIDHAFAEGAKKVTLLYSTQSPRNVYPNVAHCLYTADNVTNWPSWQDQLTQAIPKPPGGTVPFDPNQKKAFREELARYCIEAERFESRWHYAQNRPYTGLGAAPQTWHQNDCSSYCALAFWWAGHHTAAVASDPLNWHYSGYGNTQSAYEYLKAHTAPKDKYRIGDMAIYGSASNTVHMTLCRKEGTGTTAVFSSFGREAGPEARNDIHYHPAPLLGVYRHPALL